MTPEEYRQWSDSYKAWMQTRPISIQKLALEFMYGTYLCELRGVKQYVVGWNENDCVLVAPIVPWNSAEIKRLAVRESTALSAPALRMGALRIVERRAG